jgi:hypothetical protein
VDIVEEKMRRALFQNGGTLGTFCFKRSMDGTFARASNQQLKRSKRTVISPAHLYGHLARSSFGQHLLQKQKILTQLEETLLNFLMGKCPADDELSAKAVKGKFTDHDRLDTFCYYYLLLVQINQHSTLLCFQQPFSAWHKF